VTDEYESLSDVVLIAKQAAEVLQLTPQTVIRLAANGKIPGKKIGGRWRFPFAEMLRLVRMQAPEIGRPRRPSLRDANAAFDKARNQVLREALEDK
jgi:excisionase family DNA binding protein